ncbi:MAG: hypothetical protein AAFP26_01705 [Planctomycetota bacterium]
MVTPNPTSPGRPRLPYHPFDAVMSHDGAFNTMPKQGARKTRFTQIRRLVWAGTGGALCIALGAFLLSCWTGVAPVISPKAAPIPLPPLNEVIVLATLQGEITDRATIRRAYQAIEELNDGWRPPFVTPAALPQDLTFFTADGFAFSLHIGDDVLFARPGNIERRIRTSDRAAVTVLREITEGSL